MSPRFYFDPSQKEDTYSLGVDTSEFELPELSSTGLGSIETIESPPLILGGGASNNIEPTSSMPQQLQMMQVDDPLARMVDRMRSLYDTSSLDAQIQEKRNLLDSQILDSYKNPEISFQDTLINAAIGMAPALLASAFVDAGKYGSTLLSSAGQGFQRQQEAQNAEILADQTLKKEQAKQTANEISGLINEKRFLAKEGMGLQKDLFLKSLEQTKQPQYTEESLMAISQQTGVPIEALRGAPPDQVDNLIKQLMLQKGRSDLVDEQTAIALTQGTSIDPKTLEGIPLSAAQTSINNYIKNNPIIRVTGKNAIPVTTEELIEAKKKFGLSNEEIATIKNQQQLEDAKKDVQRLRPPQKFLEQFTQDRTTYNKVQTLVKELNNLPNERVNNLIFQKLPGFDENIVARLKAIVTSSVLKASERGVATDADIRRWNNIISGTGYESPKELAQGLKKILQEPLLIEAMARLDTAEQAGYKVSPFKQSLKEVAVEDFTGQKFFREQEKKIAIPSATPTTNIPPRSITYNGVEYQDTPEGRAQFKADRAKERGAMQ